MVYINRSINWELLVLILLGTYFLNNQLYLMVSIAYLGLLIYRSEYKFNFTNMYGIKFYLIFIVYSTFVGLLFNPLRSVVRDLSYILPSVIWIYIGYYSKRLEKNSIKSTFKTICLYGTIVSFLCFFKFLSLGNVEFVTLRRIFGTQVYDIGFILPTMFFIVKICNGNVFGRKIDYIFLILMFLQVGLSFGRVAILEPLVIIIIIFILSFLFYEKRKLTLNAIFIVGIFSLISILILVYALPKNISSTFVEKLLYSFDELDIDQEINSIASAMRNWRGYEMQATIEDWKNSNILERIFGCGMGDGVRIKFIPFTWQGNLDGNLLPIMHNGFATVLAKGGVVGVISLLCLFIGPIVQGFGFIYDKKKQNVAIILIAISVAAVVNTWVVNGPIRQGTPYMAWALFIGLIYSYLFEEKEID